MSAGQPPELAIDGHVATITLRRPALANRLEVGDLGVLLEQFAQVNANPDVLVLRLAATGRHFCSGFNIGSVGAEGVDAGALFEAVADALERVRPVTIAAIQGGVYGGATDLALACDFRIGTPACEMFVPAARLGLLYYRAGLERYVSRLGLATAKRLLLRADKFAAQEMLDCGFLDRVAPSVDALNEQVAELTSTLAGMAPLALLGMKKHLNRIARGTLDADEVGRDIAQANASEDLREGQQAWQQKRTPQFRGR
jgi:enoyl-CoA hydratase/carnithine racemase